MLKTKIYIGVICWFITLSFAHAQTAQTFPFMGRVKAKDINLRVDSTVSAPVICQLREGDRLEVVAELYEWYKVRLPKYAPAYIHKDLVVLVNTNTATVIKDKINIRLLPGESAPIIGRLAMGEAVNILEFRRDWYKIQPTQNSFGWINKKFVEKSFLQEVAVLSPPHPQEKLVSEKQVYAETITLEGILQPYGRVFKREATHKIIDSNKKTYLLKGNTVMLNSLTHLKVKVSGRIVSPPKAKYPLIEVGNNIEVVN